jgi:hypothetical protein
MPISEKLRKTLEEKGWETKDIEKAINIMQNAPGYSPEKQSKISSILYWMTLLLIIVGNLLLSVVLVPFLLVISGPVLYIMVSAVALVWGLLFNIVIDDIEELDEKHHIIAGIFIPFIAVFNVYMIVNLSNAVDKALNISEIQQNPWIVGGVYVLAFMLPFSISKIKERQEKKK